MKLFKMFSFLFMKEPYTVQFIRIGKQKARNLNYMKNNNNDNNSLNGGISSDDEFVCKLTLSNVTCEGRGMNRFEA